MSGEPRLSLGRPYRRAQPDAVRATDADALLSRLSACRAGYLPPDAYADMLRGHAEAPHRPPIINIGTYLRASEVDAHVQHFIETGACGHPYTPAPRVQIVSLGAGSDTRFWRLRHARLARYVELDFPSTTSQKAAAIHAHPTLRHALEDARVTADGLVSSPYVLLGIDIRTLPHGTWQRVATYLDPALPTLLLCECVLAYMDIEVANAALRACLATLPCASILSYDMCISSDTPHAAPTRFGQVMLQNLAARQLTLPGARGCTSTAAYVERFQHLAGSASHLECHAYTLRESWHQLESEERRRVSMLERLDEVEELEMLLSHYCIAWIDRAIVQ